MIVLVIGFISKIGAPGEIRTPDLLVRSQALYPTELRARTFDLLDLGIFADALLQPLSGGGSAF